MLRRSLQVRSEVLRHPSPRTMSVPEACRTGLSSNEDNVPELQRQIEYHLRMVYDLRYRINQQAAISRLPPEVLCRIFHFARDACNVFFWKPSEEVNWTIVTHICRYWRDVALNDPSLWAMLPLQIPKWTTEMLRRSQEVSLSVRIDLSTIDSSVVSEVFGQAHRLARLTLEKSRHVPLLQDLFVEWGSLQVPNLEKLCLKRSTRRPAALLLPERLFDGTVKLRHLELSRIDIGWDSHLLKSLTTLVIDDLSASGIPNWLQLRSMLQRMPELQSLTLRRTLPSDTPETTLVTSPIHLPFLKMLCIDDEATKCRSFLRIVSFSDSLEMSKGQFYIETQQTATNICDLLSSATRKSSGTCLSARARSLIIAGTLHQSQPLNMSFETANDLLDLSMETDIRRSEAEDLPGLKFEITEGRASGRGGDACNEIFAGMFQAFHFQTLLELDISCLNIPSPMPKFRDTLAATYGTLPMLCNVVVGYETASALIDILSIGSDEQGDWDTADDSDFSSCDGSDETDDSDEELDMSVIRSSSPVAFSALRNLKLYDVPFDGDRYDPVFVVRLAHLEKCLINRSRRGVGILVLVLENCRNLVSEDVAQLQDLVPDVDWYEIEGSDESEED